jgi:RNA polymerase sigma-70 factor (sigma-E family)
MDDDRGQPGAGEAGYVAFVEAAWGRYLRVARLLTGDPHRAEELLQDCLVKLYPRWRRVTRGGDPHAYLRRMLVNGNVSRWRRARRERLVAEPPDSEDVRASPGDPDEGLRRALMLLSRQQRAVVVLRYYADLTEKDVAAALGCSVGTIKIHHFRAMARLRELLPYPDRRTEGVPR